MAADQDPEPGARPAARLFGELQRQAVGGHDVVAPDGALVLDAEDLVEIDAAHRHKGGGGVGRPYWEKVGIKVKRRPLDRAVFMADFRARAYPGVTLGYAAPLVGPEPWEFMIRAGHSKAAVHLFVEHPKLDEFIDRLATEPNYQERVRIMR